MSQAGGLISNARRRSGISQRELARRAGTSQAAISRIESGREEPTLERVEQILAGLGWRPRIELEPIEIHDEEPRRLYADVDGDPAVRLEGGLNMIEFGNEIFGKAKEPVG
jgi:transcriptional regulator with XRE-family HTH domain